MLMNVLFDHRRDFKTITSIKIIRDTYGCELLEAKGAVETVMRGGIVVLDSRADAVIDRLCVLGVDRAIHADIQCSDELFQVETTSWALEAVDGNGTLPGNLYETALAAPSWLGLSLSFRCLAINRQSIALVRDRIFALQEEVTSTKEGRYIFDLLVSRFV
jgi:hypothetical protein